MNWELYEVWSVDQDGHEDLVDTTKSLKEAREMGQLNIGDGIVECIIYRENEDGDLEELERIK
jgi:hypothetical protein